MDYESLLTPEWAKVLPTSNPREFLVSPRPAAKQTISWDKPTLFWDSTGKRYIYNLVTKEKFCDKPDISTLSKTIEARKTHATTNSVSTSAIPKLTFGWDQMNWQEVVNLLGDIFAYADVQIVVCTREENIVHAMSADGDP